MKTVTKSFCANWLFCLALVLVSCSEEEGMDVSSIETNIIGTWEIQEVELIINEQSTDEFFTGIAQQLDMTVEEVKAEINFSEPQGTDGTIEFKSDNTVIQNHYTTTEPGDEKIRHYTWQIGEDQTIIVQDKQQEYSDTLRVRTLNAHRLVLASEREGTIQISETSFDAKSAFLQHLERK